MRRCLWIGCCIGALVLACSDRPRRNPLDPQANDPQSESFSALTALALDGQVELQWDFSHFFDIEGYRLYRRQPEDEWEPITSVLASNATAYVDSAVQNGMNYEYQLSLFVAGEAERPSGRPVPATPGPEIAWVADRHSGLVWKISADARSAHFAQGRFFDLATIALDVADGSCWVSDRGFAGLYRIAADGALASLAASVETPGDLAIDAGARIGWLVDSGRQRVFWFSLAATDPLPSSRSMPPLSSPWHWPRRPGAAGSPTKPKAECCSTEPTAPAPLNSARSRPPRHWWRVQGEPRGCWAMRATA